MELYLSLIILSIYVGYRFYETADQENLIDYDDTVLYPFGYGLSYTTFEQEMGDIQTLTLEFDVEDMEKLRTDYLDLLLIHQPFGDYYGTYRAMEEFYKAGKIRAIGVSNFGPDRYLDLEHFSEIKPAVNQVETHVFQQQKTAREYMQKYGCQIESWGPFAEGKNGLFTNPVLTEIGKKYEKTAAQTALRFLLQSDVVVIPKSVHKERMKQNIDVFDFTLTAEDMAAIEALDGGESLFFSHYDPKTVEWFMSIL